MSEVSKPEVGSVWTVIGTYPEVVTAVKKRGRGWQVVTEVESAGQVRIFTHRLRDFVKLAKAA